LQAARIIALTIDERMPVLTITTEESRLEMQNRGGQGTVAMQIVSAFQIFSGVRVTLRESALVGRRRDAAPTKLYSRSRFTKK
jgi:hypothetical protein